MLTPNDVTLIVTGFPRSGTSMMMRLLKRGGLDIMADPEFEQPQHRHDPYGALEVRDVAATLRDNPPSFTAGKVLKVVTPYIAHLIMDRPLKVIFMQRDITEIITSLLAMKTIWDVDIAESVDWARGYLRHWKVPTLYIEYHELVKYPKSTITRIQEWLEVDGLDVEAMVASQDKNARTRYKRDPSAIPGSETPDKIIKFGVGVFTDLKVETYIDPRDNPKGAK